MKKNKIFILVFCMVFSGVSANAQLEAVHLSGSGFSGFGFGVFLNVGYPVTRGDVITSEGSAGFFDQVLTAVPLAMGYRHTFSGKGYGLYIEPQFGYTFVVTDIQQADSSSKSLPVNAKGGNSQPSLSGLTAALGFGYIFPGKLALNLGFRYEHIFVTGDPQMNVLSLRFTHTIICGRRRCSDR